MVFFAILRISQARSCACGIGELQSSLRRGKNCAWAMCRMTRAHWVFSVCDNDFVVCSSAALAKPPGLIPRLMVCAFPRRYSESEGPIKVTAKDHTYSEKTVLKHRAGCANQDRHFQFSASSRCRRCIHGVVSLV